MVPRYPGSMLTLNAQAQALMGDLRYIQSLAETHGQRYCFKQVTNRTYSLFSTNATIASTTIGTDANYDVITITVSGSGNATLQILTADY